MTGGRYGLALDGRCIVRKQHSGRSHVQAGAIRDCTERDGKNSRDIIFTLYYRKENSLSLFYIKIYLFISVLGIEISPSDPQSSHITVNPRGLTASTLKIVGLFGTTTLVVTSYMLLI